MGDGDSTDNAVCFSTHKEVEPTWQLDPVDGNSWRCSICQGLKPTENDWRLLVSALRSQLRRCKKNQSRGFLT